MKIEGNRALPAARLREAAAEELERFSGSGRRRSDADDAAFRMTLAYREQGYAFAEVGYRIAPDAGEPTVVFTVEEGPRVLLADVTIEGSAAFAPERLRAFFPRREGGLLGRGDPVPFVAEDVRVAVGALRDYYRDEGYLDVEVSPPRIEFRNARTRADVVVTVAEGPRHVVREATYAGDIVPEAVEALGRIARDATGRPDGGLVELAIRGGVTEVYGNHGYPDAAVQVARSPGASAGDVLLRVTISSGVRVRISGIEVAGNARTRSGFILRRVRLAPEDRYRLDAVKETVRELYATGLFSRVDVRLEGEGEERTLVVELEELPALELTVSAGWSSYELLRAAAGFRNRNLFGTGRSAGLDGVISEKRTAVTAHLGDPRFFGTPLVATFPVSYRRDEEPSFTRRQVEIAPQLAWQATPSLSATVRYPLQFAWTGAFSEVAPPELADENYRVARLALQARYDSRRELFYPTRGLEATLSGEVAEPALASQLSFLRAVATLRGYVSLSGTTVLALRGESGIALPTRGEIDLPLGERFFLGGERTVRSFGESGLGSRDEAGRPVGGLGYNLASAELRQRIAGNLSAALFIDVGNVSPNRSSPELFAQAAAGTLRERDVIEATRRDLFRDFRAGIGGGVRYILPVGPARLDVAWNPDPREGEDDYAVHFSVGMPF